MNRRLTIAYITGRYAPMFGWTFDSLEKQVGSENDIDIIVISAQDVSFPYQVKVSAPKYSVWQGKHRLTSSEWWAMSNARNTAICLAQDGYIVFLDDRCVLQPGWLHAVREAMDGNYAIAGTYKKVHNLVVKDGLAASWDNETQDSRMPYASNKEGPAPCGGEWFFGCSCGLPLEWALNIGGYDEDCDSLSFEDCIFGIMLEKNGYPIRFDPRMAIIQDRTPGQLGPEYKRTDKGISPCDKSHRILEMVQKGGRHKAPNYFGEGGIRALRERVLKGEPFPIMQVPQNDWFDGQLVKDFK